MKVTIIGSGNVATVLGKMIKNGGHDIVEVAGRNKNEVKKLTAELLAVENYNLDKIEGLSDIYIIAVSDKAINEIASQLRLTNQLVVHTAAAVPANVLEQCSSSYGVIYPLQTLNKEGNTIPPMPLLVNGNNENTTKQLLKFCSQLSENVQVATDEERLKLHLCAVLASNFTNHLFALTQKYCTDNGIDFNLLIPIIEETVNRIKTHNAANVQTGPAIRNDANTLDKHRTLLSDNATLLSLYNALTKSIIDFYKPEE